MRPDTAESRSHRGWLGAVERSLGRLARPTETRIDLAAAKSSTKEDEKDSGGYNGNRRRRPGRSSGGGHKNHKTGSDTMLGIDKLYSLWAKGHNI
jgi:hypothetical protein